MKMDKEDSSTNQTKDDSSKSDPQAKQVLKLVSEGQTKLFHDQFNNGYLAPYGNGKLIFKIKSRQCRIWLIKIFWENTGKVLNSNALQSVIHMLEARASFDGPKYELHTRVAYQDETFWYDLGDGTGVRITANGWEIIGDPPIIFQRFSHQKPQVVPQKGGKIEELLGFLNLQRDVEGKLSDGQLLIICWVIFGFIPGFPHPAPVINGPYGSKKSSFQKVLKELLDPSAVQVQSSPTNINDFIQTASHHWFLILDNVSSIPDWLSDAICRVITGGGFQKRELFTDDEDIIYNFRHIIGINGINLVVTKADLLDRSLIFTLNRTHTFEREEVFWNRFEDRKPYILGAIFDTLVKTLQILKSAPSLEEDFRMADFAHWAAAISEVLGYGRARFLIAYKNNITSQNDEALDASPVGLTIIKFLSDEDSWEGTPTELLSELDKIAIELRIDQKHRSWPKDARWLWRRISEVLPNLEAEGIKASKSRDDQRFIIFEKVARNDDSNDSSDLERETQSDITDNTDINSTAHSNNIPIESLSGDEQLTLVNEIFSKEAESTKEED